MDLIAKDRHSSNCQLQMEKTGGKTFRTVYIIERVQALGKSKSKGLVGFHNFTGGDYGGKFVGISKETWMIAFLALYAPEHCPIREVPDIRWELFRTKNIEGEKLPPTVPTLFLHILWCNFITMRDKSYVEAHPSLPPLTDSGWELVNENHLHRKQSSSL